MALHQNKKMVINLWVNNKLTIIRLLALFVSTSLFFTCKNDKTVVELNCIKGLMTTGVIASEEQPLLISCTPTNDTAYTNTSYTFNQSIELLKHRFDSIDKLHFNNSSKLYLKHLYLANMVANTCSALLLGNQFGFSPCQSEVSNWNRMTLEACYTYANTNKCTIWCGDRAAFYKRLSDSLLHTPIELVSIKNVHTYPLITIEGKRYIVDPFDLFIAIDTLTNRVLDYETIKNKTYKNICIKDVKQLFGKHTTLISTKLWQTIQLEHKIKKSTVCESINSYVKKNSSTMLKKANLPGNVVFVQQHVYIQTTPKGNYSFALKSESKLGSIKYSIPNFYRQYFGAL